ncbi:tetratricopeptide repeat protein [Flavobacterium sp. WC2409]|uniref:Tetratricopeptide repeat protein n=1 Tax=Flavobacterium sp. WC2409 TaxID=3234139 RepID=A0AB39W2Q6_9FLAO
MRILKITVLLFSSLLFIQCKHNQKQLVAETYIDSLITNYGTPKAITDNEKEIQFWQSRINGNAFDMVNKSRYAGNLVARFHLTGDINDVTKADSLLLDIENKFENKQAGPFLALSSNAILQHHFKNAENYLKQAKAIGIKNAESYATTFDVDFELGNIEEAAANLDKMKDPKDFGYQFRKSKMAHYLGELEESISRMEKADSLVENNPILKSTALSNVGDLYTHAGKLDKALACYQQSLKINNSDLHSLMGIGWIALVNDGKDALATKIFEFVQTKTKSPDPLYKLILVAQHKKDAVAEAKYAKEFEAIVTDSIYGKMYNKYLIQLYTGILKNPGKAEALAKAELQNRATPQTYSWYAFALLNNNKIDEANAIYKKHISGKPLEALELYYMGRLMEASKKGYNATAFFKAANENFYDLSPSIGRDLESKLE